MMLDTARTAAPAKGGSPPHSLNILVVGEESAGMELVRTLVRGPHRIVSVLTSPEIPGGKVSNLWGAAKKLGLPTLPAKRVKDPSLAVEIRAKQVDVLLNVHSLYTIHSDVLAAPRLGSFNLHPGPLPRYAGLNCVSWALYRGERRYGVTLHKMEPEIDAGAIIDQALFEIEDIDTALSVTLKCVKAGLPLIHGLLHSAAETGAIRMIPQDLSQRQFYGKEVPQGGWLDWSQPARAIFNFIRAFDYFPFRSPWGFPKTSLNGDVIGIVKATLLNQAANVSPGTVGTPVGSMVRVACGDEWIGVQTVFSKGEYRDPVEISHPGVRLSGFPGR
jgi:methionyl-tRNA formyltransferase